MDCLSASLMDHSTCIQTYTGCSHLYLIDLSGLRSTLRGGPGYFQQRQSVLPSQESNSTFNMSTHNRDLCSISFICMVGRKNVFQALHDYT